MLIAEIATTVSGAAAVGAGILWRRERVAHRRTRAETIAQAASTRAREAVLRRLAEGWLPALVHGWAEPFDPSPGDELAGTAFAAALEAIVAQARTLARGRTEEQQRAAGWYGQAEAAKGRLAELEEEQRARAAAARMPAWTEALLLMARRAHPLVDEAVGGLSEAERGVEDPELLHILFGVDHRAVLLRRLIENAALLAGQVPRRLTQSTALATVLRTGSAEIHAFWQVQHIPPREELYVPGHVASALTRIVAELTDNATRFSPSESPVVVSTTAIPEGLVVTVQDLGVSLSAAQLEWLNGILAWPDGPAAVQQLSAGQLGLLVSARLAHSHGLRISLEATAPGVRAVVFLPGHYLSREAPAAPPQVPRTVAAALVPAGPHAQTTVAGTAQQLPVRPGSDAPPLPRRVRRGLPHTAEPERGQTRQRVEPPAASTTLAASWLAATRQDGAHLTQSNGSQS